MDYQTVRLSPAARPPTPDLIQLHQTLLPTSPIVLLGEEFMGQFYYRHLIRDGLITGAIAYVDNYPAGFIVVTANPSAFMSQALRRHWFSLVCTLLLPLLTKPQRIRALWEAWQIMRHRNPKKQEPGAGEILSLGVLPQYCSPQFVRQSKLKIAQDLMGIGLEQLEKQGISVVRAIVDQDNTPAKFFYHGLGWHLHPEIISGWRVPTVEFSWHFSSKF
ncbi:hypothetical protein K4A83_06665 [Spirulina subsalsa FACHB-351]|uniref:GCN5-related N-acetyltransferase n=1 Tax=Spirulina subsalsa FACHB-351 TaxID=234711 RepID=A0ABT3L373_9CYAN|nr:hypothetical protein [Spirulina subsalsa]MCW6035954.1 hypothetical protein [Spirulina subsalsa FACHB-351]